MTDRVIKTIQAGLMLVQRHWLNPEMSWPPLEAFADTGDEALLSVEEIDDLHDHLNDPAMDELRYAKMTEDVVKRVGEMLDETKVKGALCTLIAAAVLFNPVNGAVYSDLNGWEVSVMREDGKSTFDIMKAQLASIRELREIVRQFVDDDHLWAFEEHMGVIEGKASGTVQLLVEANEAMKTADALLKETRDEPA